MKTKLPIIKVKRISFNSCSFKCPYCKIYHRHGMAGGNPNGPRASHCINPASPYFNKDYYIVLEKSK